MQSLHNDTLFWSRDLDPMTLVNKLDLDILKLYVCTKNATC